MMTLSQARERIWKSIVDHGGPTKVANATRPTPDDEPAVGVSMLYKFKTTSRMGRESVNALAPILSDVDPHTWLVAMDLDQLAAVVPPKADAEPVEAL